MNATGNRLALEKENERGKNTRPRFYEKTWIPSFGNFSCCSGMPLSAAKHVDPVNQIPSAESSAPK